MTQVVSSHITALVVILEALVTASGSVIKLTQTPETVRPPFTTAMSLRCSLEDTPILPDSDVVIGRDLSVVHKTDYNIRQVNSIVVYRDIADSKRHPVAKVTRETPAQVLTDSSHVDVSGDVNADSPERGYIKVTWQHPTYSLNGSYTCEVSGSDGLGHNVTISTSLKTEIQKPEFDDLMTYIHDLEVDRAATNQKVDQLTHDLQTEKESRLQAVAGLKNETASFRKETAQLRSQATTLNTQLESRKQELKAASSERAQLDNRTSSLETGLDRARHTEGGSFDCDRTSQSYFIPFGKPYDKAPKVFVTGVIRYLEKTTHSSYGVYVHSTYTNGFYLYCGPSNVDEFDYLVVSWISLPN